MTLNDVITQANENILILPSFQRGFKWKPENIRKLLESLVLNYPIGAVLLWQTNQPIFQYRTLESIELNENLDPDDDFQNFQGHLENVGNRYKYILDGQQRLTSIYKIFPSSINKTPYEQNLRNPEIYRFFIDLNKLNFPDIKPENFQNYVVNFQSDIDIKAEACLVKNFLSIRKEYRNRHQSLPDNLSNEQLENLFKEQLILPLTTRFLEGDNTILNNWIFEKVFQLTNIIGGGAATSNRLNQIYQNWLAEFNRNIQTVLIQKTIPVIPVPENTDWEGLSRIFETINSTGLSLTTFDLLVAKLSYWRNENNINTNLRDLVFSIVSEENLNIFDDRKNLGGIACQQLPRIFALRASIHGNRNTSLKKSEILGLDRSLLIDVSQNSCENLESALNILKENLGVRNKSYLPFKDAITLSATVEQNELSRFKAYYWFVLFTEKDLDKDSNSATKRLYETWLVFRNRNSAELLEEVSEIFNESFPSFDEVLNVSNTSSLLYRAFITFVYTQSTIDWANINVQENDITIEDHHIFPSRWLGTNIVNIEANYKNNVLNRLLVSKSANSNQYAGNNAPHIYLQNFNNLADFLIPDSFLDVNAFNLETLRNKYNDRYTLLRQSIFNRIDNLLKE